MNKFLKSIIAILGGVNTAFSILVPIALALTMIKVFPLTNFNIIFLTIVGTLATMYRAVQVFIK